MKRIISNYLLIGCLLVFNPLVSCTDYQDEIDALEYRVTVLENLTKHINSELEAVQTIVQAIEDGDFITNVTQNSEGYIITFNRSGAIVLHDGKDGENGKDAKSPEINARQDEDGVFYWTVNGEWLLTDDGQKVRCNGQDGKAVAPMVRINPDTSIWEISVDGGITWKSTGTSAKGKDGKDGRDGVDGTDGRDGVDGTDGRDGVDGTDGMDANSIIKSIDFYSLNGVTYVRFTLEDGYFDVPMVIS